MLSLLLADGCPQVVNACVLLCDECLYVHVQEDLLLRLARSYAVHETEVYVALFYHKQHWYKCRNCAKCVTGCWLFDEAVLRHFRWLREPLRRVKVVDYLSECVSAGKQS